MSTSNNPEHVTEAKPSSIHEDLFPEQSNDESKETTINSRSDMEEGLLQNSSWTLKVVILLCMLSLPVGCHYLEATVGTLKTSLKHTMHINNTQFGILVSAVTLVNTVLPLFAGVFIDDLSSLGSIRGTTCISVIIFIGSLLVSIGSVQASYPIMVTGQVIYGLGGGMIVTMQEGILSRWFRDKEIAIVIGITLCVARLTKFVAKLVCYPIVYSSNDNSAPIHVATVLCAAGVVMNIIYWIIMCKKGWATASGKEIVQPKHRYSTRLSTTRGTASAITPASRRVSIFSNAISPSVLMRQGGGFKFNKRIYLYLPGTFWMIPWIQFVMSSVLSSFDDIATEFVQFRFNTTTIMAGYQSSLTQVVPIVVAPLMGVVLHRYGKRLTNLFFATLVLVTSLVLLAYTWAPPAAGMIIFSLALALGPVSVLTSTSLLLPHELAGTGMALHKCSNNIGTTIVAIIVGYVQDLTYHDNNPLDDHSDLTNEYHGVMILYMIMGCCSTIIACIFWLMDRKLLSGWLQADKDEREKRLEVARHEEQEEMRAYRYPYYGVDPAVQAERRNNALSRIGSRLREKKTYTYVGVWAFWLLVSWVVYFVFALMPVWQDYIYDTAT